MDSTSGPLIVNITEGIKFRPLRGHFVHESYRVDALQLVES